MRGLVPRIHAFCAAGKTWMAGPSPAMTPCLWLDMSEIRFSATELRDHLQQQLDAQERHAHRHQRIGNPQRRPPGRARMIVLAPGLLQQCPRFPREKRAERKACNIDE